MAVGVALSGVVVLVRAWSAGVVMAKSGGSVPPASSGGTVGYNVGSYG